MISPSNGCPGYESGRHGDAEPFAQVPKLLLRQREFDVHRVERLQRHDRRALVEKLADADAPDTEPAGERSAHRLFCNHGADVVHLGVRLLQGRLRGLEIGLGDCPLADQSVGALEGEERKLGSCLRGAQPALLDLGIEQHEHISGLHHRARLESDRAYDTLGFGAHVGALHGHDRSDRRHARLPVLAPHGDRVDPFGRDGLLREGLADGGKLQRFHSGNRADDHHDDADAGYHR